jgi:AbrB family looped-hinge helix DNA binding protein
MKQSLAEVRTVTITSKGQISIPQALRQKAFKEGSKVAILAYDSYLELRPIAHLEHAVDLTRKGVTTSLMSESSLGKAWKAKEDEKAFRDL